MSRLSIAIVASIALAGIYSIGSNASEKEARVVVPEMTTAESATRAAAAKKVAAAHRVARAKCEHLPGLDRGNCRTDARMEAKRALRTAQGSGART